MPDPHYAIGARLRLGQPVHPPGCHCAHRRPDGTVCGAALDEYGVHAMACKVGGHLVARHNHLRDATSDMIVLNVGVPTAKEQVLSGNPADPEALRADVSFADAGYQLVHFDITVTCALSATALRGGASARVDGAAAEMAAQAKLRKYAGYNVIPLAFEAHGRMSAGTVSALRRLTARLPEAERAEATASMWLTLSVALQWKNASAILHAGARH
jgi:hypothetical protein